LNISYFLHAISVDEDKVCFETNFFTKSYSIVCIALERLLYAQSSFLSEGFPEMVASVSDVGGAECAVLDLCCSDLALRCLAATLGGCGNGANNTTTTKMKNKTGRKTNKMSMVKYRPSFKSVAAVL
jgi:hypothetical protein